MAEMKNRKWMAGLLAITVILTLLAGCGSKPAEDPKPAGQQGETSQPTPAPQPEQKKPEEPVKLVMWTVGSDNVLRQYQEIVDKFVAENPHYTVELSTNSWTGLDEKLTTAFASDAGPDLFMHGVAAVASFAANDLVVPIDNYLTASPETPDFYQAVIDGGRYEGKAYVLPVSGSSRLIYYRKDLFEEAGLDPNRGPATYDELYEYALKLTKRDANGLVTQAGFQLPDWNTWFMQYLYGHGGTLLDNNGKPTFNGKEGQAALQMYYDLAVQHKINDYAVPQTANSTPGLVTGQVAMMVATPSTIAGVDKADPTAREKIGYALMPKGSLGQNTTFTGYQGWFIAKSTKHPDAVWKLIEHIGKVESQAVLAETIMGSRKGLLEVPYVKEDPFRAAFYPALEHGVANPNVLGWTQIRDTIAEHWTKAVNDEVSPSAALNAAAQEVEKIVNELKK